MNLNKIAEESRASIEHDDLKTLLPIIASINPKNILEIGTWKGYSAETWIRAFNPIQLFTLEKDSVSIIDYTIPRGRNPEFEFLYNSDSHDEKILERIKRDLEEVDFLFIDGDHSEEGVRKDFEMYSPLVRKGGVIVFHDVVYTSPDPLSPVMVKPLWDELKLQYPYVEIKAGKNSTGIGLIWV